MATVRVFYDSHTQDFLHPLNLWFYVAVHDVFYTVNGGAYFYRNFVGLSRYFPQIYAIDQLGWGLSSRPRFSQYFRMQYNYFSSRLLGKPCHDVVGSSDETDPPADQGAEHRHSNETSQMVHTAESFFVESLEVWRKVMGLESMVLAGHSMGGLLAVAYAERYPQHVHHLVLISPVGVPEESAAMIAARAARTTWRLRLFEALFPWVSPGDVLRWLPESMGRNWIREYVTRRLPAISDPLEQEALTEYLYSNNGLLPGSGEYCLPKLLQPSVFGRKPLQYRIPRLQVPSCSFMYGDSDWMDSNGGLYVEHACAKIRKDGVVAPAVDVYQVSQAGHLLMLENNVEFNNGLIWAVGVNQKRSSFDLFHDDAPLPAKLLVNGRSLHSQEQPKTDEGSSNVPPILDPSAT
jgi:cardiolipin-specific phospholipase